MRLKALILFSLVGFTLSAQNPQTDPQPLSYVVSGTVIDAENGHPLQYVNVTIPGTKYATVSNAEGNFTIKSSQEPKSVTLSLLGYQTSRIGLGQGEPVGLTIKMRRHNLTLDESVVVYGDPYVILGEAMDRIRQNYPNDPELFDCFYRETIQKKNRYIYISEAVGRMFKNSYPGTTIGDRITVDKSRILESQSKRDTLSIKVAGGPSQAVLLDIVKNGELLDNEALSYYNLEMAPPEAIDDRIQFVIRLIPSLESEFALQKGLIYIDRETLAFTRFDLTVDMSDKAKVTQMMLVKKPAGLRFTPQELSVQYNYALEDGKARVRYVRTTMRFKCDWKKRFFRNEYSAVTELVTTDRRSGENRQISRKEAFREREILSDKAALDYDPDFWKDYNIIEPTERLDKAIGRIRRINQ